MMSAAWRRSTARPRLCMTDCSSADVMLPSPSLSNRRNASANTVHTHTSPRLRSASHVSCQLPAFAGERRTAAPLLLGDGRSTVDRYLLPGGRTAANPQQRSAVGEWKERRTDGRTPDRNINPAGAGDCAIVDAASIILCVTVRCPSVYPNYRPLQQRAAGLLQGRRYRSTAAGIQQHTAFSGKCEQCRVYSRRRRLSTDLGYIVKAKLENRSIHRARKANLNWKPQWHFFDFR